ncbi:3-isopropylmalate dehydratase small subunit [Lentisalinibacter orientalis]|uniref:3-isopropylmalate dehydratase small subunit n=1 Tax=Lentisalinibacter orientalis TaxID=2992241 RepID=UPI00386648A8
MEPFVSHSGIAAPLLRINIDTDAIIPSREMKRVSREGLGEGLFANWRYRDVAAREEDPEFVLNREPFRHATILLAGENFGCGSSREHAVWALKDFGFRAVIAPGFGSIFYGNCVRNGILPVRLAEPDIEAIALHVDAEPSQQVTIDLPSQTVTDAAGADYPFDIGAGDKEMLLQGLDPIAKTMKLDAEILAFRERDRADRPWIYL